MGAVMWSWFSIFSLLVWKDGLSRIYYCLACTETTLTSLANILALYQPQYAKSSMKHIYAAHENDENSIFS